MSFLQLIYWSCLTNGASHLCLPSALPAWHFRADPEQVWLYTADIKDSRFRRQKTDNSKRRRRISLPVLVYTRPEANSIRVVWTVAHHVCLEINDSVHRTLMTLMRGVGLARQVMCDIHFHRPAPRHDTRQGRRFRFQDGQTTDEWLLRSMSETENQVW